MKKFMVEISFIDKPQEVKMIEQTSNQLAISESLLGLDGKDRNNVIGVKITHIKEI